MISLVSDINQLLSVRLSQILTNLINFGAQSWLRVLEGVLG